MREVVSSIPGLCRLNDAELALLESEATVIVAAVGDTLFAPFSRTNAYWFLIEGEWKVVRKVLGVEHLMFEADRVGSWTGGIPLIDAIAPPATIVLAPSRFLRIPIATMERLAATNANVAKRLLEGLNWGTGHIASLVPATAAKP
jgi:hypothetical protein